MSAPSFEEVYRDKLWRVSLTTFNGERRLAIWSHYQDRATGEWKPCGGKRETPGFIVPADRLSELEAAIIAIGAQLRSASG